MGCTAQTAVNVSRNTMATPVTAPKRPMMDHFALKVNALVQEAEYGTTICLRKNTTQSMLQLLLIKQINPV